jgi:tryptophanyl-tRNA synthetase
MDNISSDSLDSLQSSGSPGFPGSLSKTSGSLSKTSGSLSKTLDNNFNLQTFTEKDLKKLSFLPKNLLRILDSHRDFDKFDETRPENYYLYTGRGPSIGSFHIGHLLGLKLVLELNKIINNPIYFMISDDEKIFRDKINFDEMNQNVSNTIKQLNTIGFNDTNTVIHKNSQGFSPDEYKILIKLMNLVSINQLKNMFGEKKHVGEYLYVFIQLLPCFISDKQCVVIAGKDQEPFFRIGKYLGKKLSKQCPIIIYTKNVPSLDGTDKMSSTLNKNLPMTEPIFINDNLANITKKVKSIKQVGSGSLDELFNEGCDLDKDIPFRLIELFDENEDNIDIIRKYYSKSHQIDPNNLMETMKKLEGLVGKKGYMIREDRMVITTFGVRTYLTNLLGEILKKYY